MKYSHERLEKLINYISDKPESSFERFFIPDFENFQKAFHEEVKNVETYLIRQSMCIKNELTFKMLIHQYQAIIVSCLDKLSAKQKEENIHYPQKVYEFTIEEMEKLFSFIQNRFENYFNCEEKIPDIYLQRARQKVKEGFKLFEKHLLKEPKNKEILQIINYPLQNFLNEGLIKKVTYRNLIYTEKFIDQCFNFRKRNSTSNKNEDHALVELLVFTNFNYSGMATYIINKISIEINGIESKNNQFEELNFLLKKFNQLPERLGMCYNYKNASLKEQIISWIAEEIYFIEKNYKNAYQPPDATVENIDNEEKLHLSISVDVLTLIARAAKDNNVILNKHRTEIFKNISRHLRTKNAANLSVNSMIKKSYVAERSNKESAIDILHDMIKRIHGY